MPNPVEPAITVPQALIHAMILVAGADRDMKNVELGQVGRIVRQLPVFAEFDVDSLPATAQEVAVLVQLEDGVERALRLIADSLPPRLRETCYLCACEVAVVDGRAPIEELRLLQRLRGALGLDRLTSAALERATVARLAGP
jgi:tellurite resistance protein